MAALPPKIEPQASYDYKAEREKFEKLSKELKELTGTSPTLPWKMISARAHVIDNVDMLLNLIEIDTKLSAEEREATKELVKDSISQDKIEEQEKAIQDFLGTVPKDKQEAAGKITAKFKEMFNAAVLFLNPDISKPKIRP